jgi:hypothetical protein
VRIAALDLGSNSFHLLIADAHPDGTFEPLVRDKEMLRLGSVVASTGAIGPAAGPAVEVVRRFRALAESMEVDEVVACAPRPCGMPATRPPSSIASRPRQGSRSGSSAGGRRPG